MNEFGRFLKVCRKSEGQSLRDVSAATGIALGQLSDIETGKQANPTAKTLKRLCKFYGLNAGAVLELL